MAPVNLNYEEITNFTHPTMFGSCCVTRMVLSARRFALSRTVRVSCPKGSYRLEENVVL